MKKLAILILVLFHISAVTPAWSGTVVGDVENNTVQENVKDTDQFTPYQEDGKALHETEVSKEVKDRIKDLSDVKSQSKAGTITPKDINPSVGNH